LVGKLLVAEGNKKRERVVGVGEDVAKEEMM
jgi:hypothetical protein